MKNKFLFTALMCCGIFFPWLQTIQAQTLIGGSVHWLRTKEEGIRVDDGEAIYSELSIAPRIGFYQNKFIYGFDARIWKNQNAYFNPKTMENNKTTYLISTIGAFGRYVHKTNDWLGLWAELQSGLQYGQLKYGPGGINDNDFGVFTVLRPGIMVFATDQLSIDVSFGNFRYHHQFFYATPNSSIRVAQTGFDFNTGNVQFGINWTIFPRKNTYRPL